MRLHTHLNFGGNCGEAFAFYEQHLGGKIGMVMTHEQQPGASPEPEMRGKICGLRDDGSAEMASLFLSLISPSLRDFGDLASIRVRSRVDHKD